jgi:PHD/YefM family antitoxin component YafN of YafNO toxin-antitoxin module
MEIQDSMSELFDQAYSGEILLVTRSAHKNVVILSEAEFNKREKALRNAEYLAMLDEAVRQAEHGEIVTYTMDELKDLIDGE